MKIHITFLFPLRNYQWKSRSKLLKPFPILLKQSFNSNIKERLLLVKSFLNLLSWTKRGWKAEVRVSSHPTVQWSLNRPFLPKQARLWGTELSFRGQINVKSSTHWHFIWKWSRELKSSAFPDSHQSVEVRWNRKNAFYLPVLRKSKKIRDELRGKFNL